MERSLRSIFVIAIITIMEVTAGETAASPNVIDKATGMEFIFVKGGCFQMGDTFGDGDKDEKPIHEVCVSNFYMGKYEVTQYQWKKVMGRNPSYFTNCGDDCPVEQVSWNDIQEFVNKLNYQSGKKYRLPTEAEWEYAARSGGKKEHWAGTSNEPTLGDYAWYPHGSKTHPVGQKKPNGLGLYDMTGNVWEWCNDRYGGEYYKQSPRDNPQGPGSSSYRVVRGGSWSSNALNSRASSRARFGQNERSVFDGFRVAVTFR